METIKIYYFSGTGNSLYLAKEIQKKYENIELFPIVKFLKEENMKIDAEVVGFIYPLHLTMAPFQVREFIRKSDFQGVEYIFSIATRGGTISLADICIEKLLNKKKKKLNSHYDVNMIMNTPTGIRPTAGNKYWADNINKENIDKNKEKISNNLNALIDVIENRKTTIKRGFVFYPLYYLLGLLIFKLTNNNKNTLNYYVDLDCTGCGICEKVCLSDKIKIIDSKPTWQKEVDCFNCFACFNSCSQQSILLKNYTDKKGRYIHPDVSVNELANQK